MDPKANVNLDAKARQSMMMLKNLDSQFARANSMLQKQETAVRGSAKVNLALRQSALAITRLDANSKMEDIEKQFEEANDAIKHLESTTVKETKNVAEIQSEKEKINEINASTGSTAIAKKTPMVQFRPPPEIVKARKRSEPLGENSPYLPSDVCEGGFLPMTYIDLQYGEIATIDALWVFKEEISEDRLKEGLELLLTELPSLAGRINSKRCGIDLTNDGVPFYLQEASGSWKDFPREIEPRNSYLDKPEILDMFNGTAPVMTVVLTHMMDGGCVLGVTVSHMVAGGNGFFAYVMPRFAAFVRTCDPSAITEKDLGFVKPIEDRRELPQAKRSLEQLQQLIDSLENPPLSFRDLLFGRMKRSVLYMLLRNSRDQNRVFVHFPPEELDAIKNEVLANSDKLKWISTANALAAHLTKVLASLAPNSPATPTQAGLIIDHVNKLKHLPKGLMANTFYLYSCTFDKWINKSTTSEIAEQLHQTVQNVLADPQALIDEMAFEEDCLKWNYQPNPRLKLSIPVIVNNQSKFKPLVQLDFGTGVCEMYVPHKAGDSLLMVPATDRGIDVWLSTVNIFTGNPLYLKTEAFQREMHKYAKNS